MAPDGSRRVPFDFPPSTRRAFACIDIRRDIAQAHGVSVARIALAWVLHHPFVTSVVIGAKSIEQRDDNLAAPAVNLSAESLERLERVGALLQEYLGRMFERIASRGQRVRVTPTERMRFVLGSRKQQEQWEELGARMER